MLMTLSIIAILLAALALLPYGMGIYLRWRWAPRFRIKVEVKKVTPTATPQTSDVDISLSWASVQGKPFFVSSVIAILPLHAVPSSQAFRSPKGNELETSMYIEGGEWPPRIAVMLESNESESWYSDVAPVYYMKVKLAGSADIVRLALRWRIVVDSAKLGWLAIFYPVRDYISYKGFDVDLHCSSPQHFE